METTQSLIDLYDQVPGFVQGWLKAQPWYRDLWEQYYFGSGVGTQLGKLSQAPIELYGSGGLERGGLFTGGGGVKVTAPISKDESLSFLLGGGGTYGDVKTPRGILKVGEFFPEAGILYQRKF